MEPRIGSGWILGVGLALSANFNLMYSKYPEVVFCVVFASDEVVAAGFFICLSD